MVDKKLEDLWHLRYRKGNSLMNIAEIKQQIMQITNTLTDNMPAIAQDIEGEFNKVVEQLSWLSEGSSSQDIKNTIQDVQTAISDLNERKSQMYQAAEQLRNYINRI